MKRSFQLMLIASVFVLLVVLVSTLNLFSPVDGPVGKHQEISQSGDSAQPVSLRPSSPPQSEAPEQPGSRSTNLSDAQPGGDSKAPVANVPSTSEASSVAGQSSVAVSSQNEQNSRTREAPPVQSESVSGRKTGFPGIKQDFGDIMLSSLRHAPGDAADSFVVTFTRMAGASPFDGSVWIIGEYRQRGTTAVMDMTSHPSIRLSSDGNPQSPEAGARLIIPANLGEKVSKKLTVNRPGFEGEELVGVRVGIYDRLTRTLRLARVSASQLAVKKSVKRAKVEAP